MIQSRVDKIEDVCTNFQQTNDSLSEKKFLEFYNCGQNKAGCIKTKDYKLIRIHHPFRLGVSQFFNAKVYDKMSKGYSCKKFKFRN